MLDWWCARLARVAAGVLGLVVGFLFLGLSASAQEVAEPPAYRAAVREALAEFNDGNFPEAHALFVQAHAIFPNARTFRGLGITSFAVRAYVPAVRSLEQALASPIKPLDGALRIETEDLLRRAYGFVGRFTLRLQPASVRLYVDKVQLESPLPSVLMLELGRHVVEAEAPGHRSEARTLEVLGGEHTHLALTLSAVPVEPAPVATAAPSSVVPLAPAAVAAAELAPPATQRASTAPQLVRDDAASTGSTRSDSRPLRKNPWLWTSVGVGAALLAVVIGVVASRDDERLGEVSTTANTPVNGVIQAPLVFR